MSLLISSIRHPSACIPHRFPWKWNPKDTDVLLLFCNNFKRTERLPEFSGGPLCPAAPSVFHRLFQRAFTDPLEGHMFSCYVSKVFSLDHFLIFFPWNHDRDFLEGDSWVTCRMSLMTLHSCFLVIRFKLWFLFTRLPRERHCSSGCILSGGHVPICPVTGDVNFGYPIKEVPCQVSLL